MSGPESARLFELVERAHPNKIVRSADEWERCARVLDDAADRIERIVARQHEIGGATGPTMARASVATADVLRVKARDLYRGAVALREVADATKANLEEKRRIDRDHPDDGNHVVIREEGARSAADGQEATLRRGIAVMKSIELGDDPRRTPVTVTGPGPVIVDPPTWWPRTDPPPPPPPPPDPEDEDDDVHDDDRDQVALPQGPGGLPLGGAGGTASALGVGSVGGGSGSINPGSLAGAALLGTAGAGALGARAASVAGAAGGVRPIGVGGGASSGGVLGRSGGAAAGGGGRGAGAGGRGGGAGAGAGAVAGRGGRRKGQDREQGRDRDLHDDGDGWLDDEAGPDVLR